MVGEGVGGCFVGLGGEWCDDCGHFSSNFISDDALPNHHTSPYPIKSESAGNGCFSKKTRSCQLLDITKPCRRKQR